MQSPEYILENGTRVVTHPTLDSTTGMLIAKARLDARKPNQRGTIAGVVGGHGGDVYWVQHEGGEVAAYCFTEFELG